MISKEQTSDFIVGYVFSQINKDTMTLARCSDLTQISTEFRVPKVWFGLRCTKDPLVRLSPSDEESYIYKLKYVFREMSPRTFSLDLSIAPDLQYISFNYKVYRKKKMTLSQIEAELGYEIEIVKEK